ncbi:MAG: hypothetical protein AB1568_16255 [Thermodesulfobacteriota bacterium]
MKKRIALLTMGLILTSTLTAAADEFVNGYFRKDGTYVQPHFRSEPNQYRYDNYSSQGNTNPYTGQRGYERNEFSDPPSYPSYDYGSQRYRYGQ